MELNMKLSIEELMKEVRGEIQSIRNEMRDGFAVQEKAFNTRITELSSTAQQREEHVVVLETATENFDKTFNAWKPEVESSLTSVKLELSKFNSFFTSEGKMLDTSSSGIVSDGTTST
jgi:phenylalanyl-tRNA synthetase alpha subunit